MWVEGCRQQGLQPSAVWLPSFPAGGAAVKVLQFPMTQPAILLSSQMMVFYSKNLIKPALS